MNPTLVDGQHLLELRLSPLRALLPSAVHRLIRRGDVVVLNRGQGALLVKRIIALGGDRVRIKEGLVFVNGTILREPYARHGNARLREYDDWPVTAVREPMPIPAGMIFVLGDNRSESLDSRVWGPMPMSAVVGKVLWPVS